jgi:hypothetical protein
MQEVERPLLVHTDVERRPRTRRSTIDPRRERRQARLGCARHDGKKRAPTEKAIPGVTAAGSPKVRATRLRWRLCRHEGADAQTKARSYLPYVQRFRKPRLHRPPAACMSARSSAS